MTVHEKVPGGPPHGCGEPDQKKALRHEMRRLAAALPAEALHTSSAAIFERLTALAQWRQATTVFFYVSVGTEPDTHRLVEAAWTMGKQVCVPRCLGRGVMEARVLCSWEELRPAGFGLLEPTGSAPLMDPGKLELVVAPCVAADKDGWRLGNGSGYYDRFLPQARCPVMCLCHTALLLAHVPHGPHDIQVTHVLTADALYTARP